jgi:hypothetical protein
MSNEFSTYPWKSGITTFFLPSLKILGRRREEWILLAKNWAAIVRGNIYNTFLRGLSRK